LPVKPPQRNDLNQLASLILGAIQIALYFVSQQTPFEYLLYL